MHFYPAFLAFCPNEISIFFKRHIGALIPYQIPEISKIFVYQSQKRESEADENNMAMELKTSSPQNCSTLHAHCFPHPSPSLNAFGQKLANLKARCVFQTMDAFSFILFMFLFFHSYLLGCYHVLGTCVKHKRCKDGRNIFLTMENVRRSGQTIRVKESQVENLGLGAGEAPKKEQAVLSGAGQRGNLLHRGPDRKGLYTGADIFLVLKVSIV